LKEEIHENDSYPTPNKFYFAVPPYLLDYTKGFCSEINKDYGILEFNCTNITTLPEHTIYYRKQAHKLHSTNVSPYFKSSLIKRVCNDNIVFYKDTYWRI
jgi:hypothetical protein